MIDPTEISHPMDESVQSHPRRSAVLKILQTLVGLTLAVFAYLWFCVTPKVPTAPIHLVRSGDGRLMPANSEDVPGGIRFEAQTGKMESKNSISSTSVCSESDHASFNCGRIAIFNQSGHLLMARLGSQLLELFKPLGFVRQVDYYPAGFRAEEGQLAPDLVVTLDLDKLTEDQGLVASTLEATVTVRAGNAAPECHNSYVDSMTPPLVQLDWCGHLEHRSTRTGVASSAAKYQQVADDIAKQIAAALTKEIGERRKKYAPIPALPADFYPAFRKPVALPWDALGDPDQAWSWHGFMNHNETLWRISTDRPPAELIGAFQKRLLEGGWGKGEIGGGGASPYLRVCQKDLVLQIYAPAAAQVKSNNEPAGNLIYVHYVDRMSSPELEAAISRALEHGASNDVLLLFERFWSVAQQQQVLKQLQAAQTGTPRAALTLARLYHRLGEDPPAKRELLRASILLRTVDNLADVDGQVRSLAKVLGDEKLPERPLDVSQLLELGFQELRPGTPVAPREVGFDQPILLFVKENRPGQSLRTFSLRVVQPETPGPSRITLAYVEASGNDRSWGTSDSDHVCRIGKEAAIRFKAKRLEAKQKFRITAEWLNPGK